MRASLRVIASWSVDMARICRVYCARVAAVSHFSTALGRVSHAPLIRSCRLMYRPSIMRSSRSVSAWGRTLMAKKGTPAQRFARIFAVFVDPGALQGDRDNAERQMDAWLNRHGKTRSDIPSILAQAAVDDAASQPPPPPSDPRDTQTHPFDDPAFTLAGLVRGIGVVRLRHGFVLRMFTRCSRSRRD
jgi:hypothetical protein